MLILVIAVSSIITHYILCILMCSSTFFKKWAKCTFRVLSNHTLRVRSHCILYLLKDAEITVSDSAMSRVHKLLGVETDYIHIM